MRNLIAAMFFMSVSAIGWAATFQGLSYATDGAVVPGKWTARYSAAKAEAKNVNAPLVCIWVRSGCGYCRNLGSALSGSSVSKWAAQRGYYFVIGVEDETVEAAQVKSFVANSTGLFPYVGVWWPKKTGGEIKERFSGRSGKMPVTAGSLAQQFMDSVDKYAGDYAGVVPKTVTVTFKPNQGTMASSAGTREVATGKAVGTLPTATRSGYRLTGWFTAASGGDRISSSTKVVKAVTYYAQWAKVYSLTASVLPKDGGRLVGTNSFVAGESFTLKATAASGYVFAGWYSGSNLRSQATTYKGVMGSANLSLTAKFIQKTADSVTIGAITAADEYETKREIVPIALSAQGGSLPTLSVTKLPTGLKFTAKEISGHAANTIYGTPTRSGLYSVQVSAKTAGGAKASKVLPLVVRAKRERIVRTACDADMGKVSGDGVFADGKKAPVRAVPLSGHCFAGWRLGNALLSRSASYAYPVDGRDVTLEADFVSKVDDLASVTLAIAGKGLSTSSVQTNVVRCGVATNWTVVARALSGTSVSASGLPSGLKLVKTLVNKELKEYAYEIAGTPSSPSKTNAQTGLVKPTTARIKVTTLGKSSVTFQYAFIVEALPSWAYGSFSGFSVADERAAGVGVASLTVSSAGKISGKFSLFGTNWTCSVTGYSGFVNPKDPAKMRFSFEGEAKYQKLTRSIAVKISPGVSNCSVAEGEGDGIAVLMYRKVWSDKPALSSPKMAKTEIKAPEGFSKLSVSVSSAGNVTFAGKLADGSSISASSTAFIDLDGVRRAYLIVPASRKVKGCLETIELE